MKLKHLYKYRYFIFTLPITILQNFKYLPFKQAIRLPIFFNKAKISGSGKFVIKGNVYPGMIKLGFNTVPLFPNCGIKILNDGQIIFNGACAIGNDSVISVATTGILSLGANTCASSALRVICHHRISFLDKVLIGWNCTFMDTDLHVLKYVNRGGYSQGYGCIQVGKNCWIANNCKLYKNVTIPQNCVVAADTILCKPLDCNENSLVGNEHPIRIIKDGIIHDWDDDKIRF